MEKNVIGIDLGGTMVKIGIFMPDGSIRYKWSIDTPKYDDGVQIFGYIAQSVKSQLYTLGMNLDDIDSIGMGVPGAVLGDNIINKCINLNMGVVDVEKSFSPHLDNKKIYVINDANAAALGELWQGSAKAYKNIVLITIGTGIGGGVIVDGNIISGKFGAGGEIGHIKIVPKDGRRCNCGGSGCFEQYCSATGLVKNYMEYKKEPKDSQIDAKYIFEKYGEGEIESKKALEDFFDKFGFACASISGVVDPDVFVIGGGVSNAGAFLLDNIKKCYKQYCFHASVDTEFITASLLNDAGIYGAAYFSIINSKS